MKAMVGDTVVITKGKETFEGVLLPSAQKGVLILKLDSGYNIGIDEKGVTQIKVVQHAGRGEDNEGKKEWKKEKITLSLQEKGGNDLPRVTILHTGGTIASKVDYKTGGVIAKFTPEDLLELIPELKTVATLSSRLVRQMSSEDIRFSHYNVLAREIVKEIKNRADAIIITHGTDTLHYTSAALAFMFERLPIPVILVGAQRSSDRGSSDAAWNLLSAIKFATHTDFADVAICMHENMNDDNCVILPATKTRKMHTSRRDAFKAINCLPWAYINPKTNVIDFLRKDYTQRTNIDGVSPKLFKEKLKVGVIKVHTNMYAEQFAVYKNWDGLVIEGTGIAGNIPIHKIDEYTGEHTKIYTVLKKMIKDGLVAVAASQTIFGRIDMNVYNTGREMQDIGIVGNNGDMTAETAFIKLSWLLSNYPPQKAKEMMIQNLRGEIGERSCVQDEKLFE